ncbi:unnamed protein product [Cochlearia groenlandica]
MAMPNGKFVPSPSSVSGNWFPDERDEFIAWIRGEFAAANAMIDSLCNHLTAIGAYDDLFYSVEEVSYNLQQVAWKKHLLLKTRLDDYQRQHYKQQRYHHQGAESMAKNRHFSDCHSVAKLASDDEALSVAEENKDNSLVTEQKQEEEDRECPATIAKTFVAEEAYEGKMVNVVEGLKLYDKMLDAKEVSQVVSLANDLRIAGRRGQLQGQSYMGFKRPCNGRGREMIQLGLPMAENSPYDESSKGKSFEIFFTYCFLGDHSQPHMYAPWFRRPVSVLSLSECEFTFGRSIVVSGDYYGSLKLSLTPGSVLRVEGNSADLAKFAIHPTRKQRILVTFIKSNRAAPKHNPVISTTTGALPTPSLRMLLSGTGVYFPERSRSSTGRNSVEEVKTDSKKNKEEEEEEEEEACKEVAAEKCDGDRGSGDDKQSN